MLIYTFKITDDVESICIKIRAESEQEAHKKLSFYLNAGINTTVELILVATPDKFDKDWF